MVSERVCNGEHPGKTGSVSVRKESSEQPSMCDIERGSSLKLPNILGGCNLSNLIAFLRLLSTEFACCALAGSDGLGSLADLLDLIGYFLFICHL
jgi:hypothetical protein